MNADDARNKRDARVSAAFDRGIKTQAGSSDRVIAHLSEQVRQLQRELAAFIASQKAAKPVDVSKFITREDAKTMVRKVTPLPDHMTVFGRNTGEGIVLQARPADEGDSWSFLITHNRSEIESIASGTVWWSGINTGSTVVAALTGPIPFSVDDAPSTYDIWVEILCDSEEVTVITTLQGGPDAEFMTIQDAGGYSDYADKNDMQYIRRVPIARVVDGELQETHLGDILLNTMYSPEDEGDNITRHKWVCNYLAGNPTDETGDYNFFEGANLQTTIEAGDFSQLVDPEGTIKWGGMTGDPAFHGIDGITLSGTTLSVSVKKVKVSSGLTKSVVTGSPISVDLGAVSYTHLTLPTNREV